MKKQLIDIAFEQLQWQHEHNARGADSGVTVALGRNGDPENPADRMRPPDCVMLYAWGEDAAKMLKVLKAVGIDSDAPDAKHFPPKPEPN